MTLESMAKMPRSLKRERNPLTRFGGIKPGGDFAEMPDRISVDLLGNVARTSPVRVRERIAFSGRCIAHEQQLPPVQVGIVAYLREARCA